MANTTNLRIFSGSPWTNRLDPITPRKADVRLPYELDFSRLVHCAAFRRLQGKTQVLGLGDSDFYRTRLTHSMEVAQVGNGIARFLQKNSRQLSKQGEIDLPGREIFNLLPPPHLISAIGLAHDLGHPPYGHGGETALNYCMREHGGFEANGQTLRILARLEKYHPYYGLNPTRRMLLGILKYPVPYSVVLKHSNFGDCSQTTQLYPWLIKKSVWKPPKCYLDCETDIVDWILAPISIKDKSRFTCKNVPPPGKLHYYHSIDASIMELADDICYSVHDLEDSIALGLVSERDFFEELNKQPAYKGFCSVADSQRSLKGLLPAKGPCGQEFDSMDAILQGLFSRNTETRKFCVGTLIHYFITNCSLKKQNLFDCLLLDVNAYMNEPAASLRSAMFDVVIRLVIKSSVVQQLEFKGQKMVIELFQTLESDPERFLPKSDVEKWKKAEGDSAKMRVICDYISGMTDEHCAKTYGRLFLPHTGSVFERI